MNRRIEIAIATVGATVFLVTRSHTDDRLVSSDSEHTGLDVREGPTGFVVTDVRGRGATVVFPDRPSLSLVEVAGAAAPPSAASSDEGGRDLFFSVSRFDPARANVAIDTFYDVERDGALAKTGATLERETAVTVDGLPGREIAAHTPTERIRVRLVLDPAHGLLYVAVGGAAGTYSDDIFAAQNFVESLHIPR